MIWERNTIFNYETGKAETKTEKENKYNLFSPHNVTYNIYAYI